MSQPQINRKIVTLLSEIEVIIQTMLVVMHDDQTSISGRPQPFSGRRGQVDTQIFLACPTLPVCEYQGRVLCLHLQWRSCLKLVSTFYVLFLPFDET